MVKIHISNIHNAALSDRVKLQHKLAEAGHAWGCMNWVFFLIR